MAHQGYGFCEFLTEEDAEYACKIMNQIKLWGKPIRVNKVRRRFSRSFSTKLKRHSLRQLLCTI
jgi:RNA recognition motif-containing protein